ncbi:MAG: ABC transporter permease [Gemmatimonadota bacterium]|nr:ABC transporter permease [Gemmatimonadota bacterium]
MEPILRDLRYVARSLVRTPGFVLVTVLTLAIGIGATTAIFSVINGVLLQPLPYPRANRIVQLWQIGPGGTAQFSDPNFDDLKAQTRSFAALAEMSSGGTVSVTGATEPVRVRATTVSRGFFDAIGVQPLRGRLFAPDELRPNGALAVLVSEGFWRRQLGANPNVLGSTLTWDGKTRTIVGVMPARLDYPVGIELWSPREMYERNPYRTGHNWLVIGRLKDGVTLTQARQDAGVIANRLKKQYGDDTWMTDVQLIPLLEQLVGQVRPALVTLLAASIVLLLIACANVVNLLVARMAMRQSELALRLALGARAWRLAQPFLVESLVLSIAGGVLGVLLTTLGLKALVSLQPGNVPRMNDIHVDWQMLLFAFGVSMVTAVALGLLTAWRATHGDIRETLSQGQRTQGWGGASDRVRSGLVIAQIAMTLVLLVGAGLLGRSFLGLMKLDSGFRSTQAVVLDISVPTYSDSLAPVKAARLFDDLITRLSALPSVTAIGGVNAFPLTGASTSNGTFLILSRVDEPLDMKNLMLVMKDTARTGQAEFRVASAGYFRAMRVPLLRGRLFDDRDGPDAPHVAVISASLAKTRWPKDDPIGKIIQFGNMDGDMHPFTIIGVVGDVREFSLASDPLPTFYAFYRQRPKPAGSFNIVMQSAGDPSTLIAASRRIVHDLRPDIPPRFRTIEEIIGRSVADRRFVLLLVGVFGASALLLATLGVYSVISYLVTQRRQEIGIRVALGAQNQDVMGLVLRQGMTLALVGIVVGALAAIGLTRLMAGLLYGISPTDPIAFGAVMLVLTAVALIASYVPARRATRVDPMSILRGG